MNVKFTLFIFLQLAICFVSCSKRVEDNLVDSGNFLRVSIDGEALVFTDVGGRWIDGGNYLEISATQDGTTWLTLTVLSEERRVPIGSYTLDDDSGFSLLALYGWLDGDVQHNYTASAQTISLTDVFSLNIHNISANSVEGSFSGRLIQVEGLAVLDDVLLTEGSFFTAIEPE